MSTLTTGLEAVLGVTLTTEQHVLLDRVAGDEQVVTFPAGTDLLPLVAFLQLAAFVQERPVIWFTTRPADALRRVEELIRQAELEHAVARARHANGNEEIRMKTGNRLIFRRPRTGRGISASCVLLDEAMTPRLASDVMPVVAGSSCQLVIQP